MKRKKMLLGIVLGVVLVGILSLLIFLVCPIYSYLAPIIGLPFDYYGEFNRVRHRLEQVSGVQILSYHQHKDITLEDFWFTIQTDGGMKLGLAFFDGNKTYQLFDHADGLAVQNRDGGNWILYPFGPDERLDAATGKEIRNAVDVLENFDKIAEVAESDRQKGVPMAAVANVTHLYLRLRECRQG